MGPKKKRGAKDTDAQAAAHDEPPEEDAPVKRARGKKRYADANVQDAVGGSPSTKKKNATEETVGGAKKSGSPSKAAAKAPAEKSVFPKSELRSVELPADKKLLKIISWNVTTLRSLVNKNPSMLTDLFKKHAPDIVFIQETKLNEADHAEYEEKLNKLVPGYDLHWNSCSLAGSKSYSGTLAMVRRTTQNASQKKTLHHFFAAKEGGGEGGKTAESNKDKTADAGVDAIVTRGLPTMSVDDGTTASEANQEGRTITVETPHVFLVATYVPNSGDKLQRLSFRTEVWDKRLQEYLKKLEAKGKPVIWCGDLNVCHLDNDIWNVGAKHLDKSAGTTKEERASFAKGLKESKMVDCFRHVHGDDAAGWFSYWSVRAGNLPWNRGLRLDYFVASEALVQKEHGTVPRVIDSQILSDFVALDHAAISLTLAVS